MEEEGICWEMSKELEISFWIESFSVELIFSSDLEEEQGICWEISMEEE